MPEIQERAYRAARLHVASQIPELAPHLREDPTIVRNTLIDHIQNNGHEIEANSDGFVHLKDQIGICKLEQNSFVSFLGYQQLQASVEGVGQDARFTDNILPDLPGKREHFKSAIQSILLYTQSDVKDMYSGVADPNTTWWFDAEERYRELGQTRRLITPQPASYMTDESDRLEAALSSPNLGHHTYELGDFVFDKTVEWDESERVVAAHHLGYLLTNKASLSLMSFYKSVVLADLDATIECNPKTETYQVKLLGSNWNTERLKEYRRAFTEVPGMKCPLHTMVMPGQTETTLTTFVHAAINLAADYRVFANMNWADFRDDTLWSDGPMKILTGNNH